MERVVATRLETSDQGTFGRWVAKGQSFYSGELPDRNNASNVSCIVARTYRVVWSWSPRFARMMYLLVGTDPRAGIREHAANFMGDRSLGYRAQLNGCVALGERLGWMEGQKVLLVSAPAVRRFEELMQRKPFELVIEESYG